MSTSNLDWEVLARGVERTHYPLWLELDGTVQGVLLPSVDAQRLMGRYGQTAGDPFDELSIVPPTPHPEARRSRAQHAQPPEQRARVRRLSSFIIWSIAVAVLTIFFVVHDRLLPGSSQASWPA